MLHMHTSYQCSPSRACDQRERAAAAECDTVTQDPFTLGFAGDLLRAGDLLLVGDLLRVAGELRVAATAGALADGCCSGLR